MKRCLPRAVLLVLLLPVFALAGGSPEPSLKEVVTALEAPFRPGGAIRDFRADFAQQSYLGALDRVEEGRGRVAVRFDRKGQEVTPRFRWEYALPTVQEIVSDGQTVWVYLPENNQVLISPLPADDQLKRDDPLAFLTGLGELSKRFQIRWADPARTEQGAFRLLLTPLQPSSFIEQLVLLVDPAVVHGRAGQAKYPLRGATIFGPTDSRTTILFENLRVNQGLKNSLFTFEPPEGVEVVRPEEGGLGF
ncbi:MAG: outer membrane lipoprotein carrier protein LolA [Syntrophotaleaceae bacterium]